MSSDALLHNPDFAIAALREAAELIADDPKRSGSLLTFGGAGQLVVTGDIHGNLRNFEKLQRFSDLRRNPGRSVLLHELIHAELRNDEDDLSIDLLVRAAAWKNEHPDNVFFLQSNHELAQLRGQEITKFGRSVLGAFEAGVRTRYGGRFRDVLEAVNEYIAALPLAARTTNGIFIAHSLPEPAQIPIFDLTVFERQPTTEDMSPGGAAYSLVWGRFHSPEVIDMFARRLGVELLIVGHTPQESGYAITGRLLTLASDHSHGVFLPIDLARHYTMAELERNIRKFVSVA